MIRTHTAIVAAMLLGSSVLAAGSASAATAGHAAAGTSHRGPRAVAGARARRMSPVPAAHVVAPAVTGDDATLTGLTCASTSSCLSAGFYIARAEGAIFGLSESWNGNSWGMVMVSGLATKADVTDALEVSCGDPTNCMIVGEHYNNPKLPVQFADTLSTGWNPVKWNNPAGAKWSVLDDVKCVGTTFCMAIGIFSKTSGGGRALAELWNGTSWRQLTAPNPRSAHVSDLSALYCESVTDCQAVGVGFTATNHAFTFEEHWNGSGWTLGSLPNVSGRNNVLNDVACFASGECVAVGNTYTSRSEHALVLRLHSGRWRVVSTPALRSAGLDGVSCPSSTLCVAAGFAGKSPLTEKWNGTKWTVLKTARTGGSRPDDSLQHVSCVSVTHCVAVGIRYNAARRSIGNHTLIEVWNGTAWRIQTSVNP